LLLHVDYKKDYVPNRINRPRSKTKKFRSVKNAKKEESDSLSPCEWQVVCWSVVETRQTCFKSLLFWATSALIVITRLVQNL